LSIKFSNTNLFSFEFMNGFHKYVLVFELVTLGTEVQLVIDMFVDLLAVTILLKESTKNTSSANVKNLAWHTSIHSTLSMTSTLMTTFTLFSFMSFYT
jgi:hypothetical protein